MQPLILIFIKLHFQLIFQQNILILRNLFCTIYLTYDDIHEYHTYKDIHVIFQGVLPRSFNTI